MKCEEFRQLIKNQSDNDNDLEMHISECSDCSGWLEREIATPPQGLTPAEWQAATARCFPEQQALPATEEPETFWSYYFTGLKYGAVFGLSIVTGFALLGLREEVTPRYDLNQRQTMSFLEEPRTVLPGFIEKNNLPVTFLENEDSELLSFVEEVEMSKFLETTKEEES